MAQRKRKLFFLGGALVVILVGGAVFILRALPAHVYVASLPVSPTSDFEEKEANTLPPSSLSGIGCENHSRRPFAVMMAADPETRPLSGIGVADLVVELPVITGGITRFMALFQCAIPEEVGSIRSARHDFIPLAMGWDAIFVHWGGSHYALDMANRGITDNINALANPYGAFYRKTGIPSPHNGFSSEEKLLNAAESLGYRTNTDFGGYRHLEIQNPTIRQSSLREPEGSSEPRTAGCPECSRGT